MHPTDVLKALEEQLLQTAVRKDPALLSSMLSRNFREFGSSGQVSSRDEIIAALEGEEPIKLTMRDWQAQMLTNQVALVTYTSSRINSEGVPSDVLRSSIWIYDDNRWQLLFHQGTKASAQLT